MRPLSAASEDGFTLVELLVVVVLIGIIGTFTVQALVQGFQKTDEVDRRVTAYSELHQGGARISRELRSAHLTCPGTALDAHSVSAVLDRAGDRWRYSFSLPAGSTEVVLDLDRWDAGSAAWVDVSDGSLGVEVDNHIMATPQALFGYLDADGVATTVARDVRTIEMNLWRAAPGDSINLVQSVNVRNGGLPCPSL